MPTKFERFCGAMVGVLAGDALGAPYETWDAYSISCDMEQRGGLVPFEYENPWRKKFPNASGKTFPPGRPTDDSDQTAALAQSLVERGGPDQRDLYDRLRRIVYGHESPLWGGKAYGAGQTTRVVLKPETWEESKALDTSGSYPSNGALMRSVPLALYFGSPEEVDDGVITRMSWVTHRHADSINCCKTYVNFLSHILVGSPYVAGTARVLTEGRRNISIARPTDPGQWPERGSAQFSLDVAFWAFSEAEDFRDGLTKAISIGGDTDTYGAIAGGLLGAHFGIEGIPKEWRDILIGRATMEKLAHSLYNMHQ